MDDLILQLSNTMDGLNNAELTQRVLTVFQMYMRMTDQLMRSSLPSLLALLPAPPPLEVRINIMNMTLTMLGYMLHYRHIDRTELSSKIYYAMLTETTSDVSPYHPLSLMATMPEAEIPESFMLLLNDGNYLPNIINVYDYGDAEKVMLLTVQQVQFAPANLSVPQPELD